MDHVDLSQRRLTPRPELAPRFARAFGEIVGSVDPVHLRACDAPLVEQLAVAVTICQDLAERLEIEGTVLPDGSLNPAIRVLRQQQSIVATLTSRLRLNPSSRADRKNAGTSTRAAAFGLDSAYHLASRGHHD